MKSKSSQKAGDNANQYHTEEGDINVGHTDLEVVVAVVNSQMNSRLEDIAIEKFRSIAYEVASERIKSLSKKTIERFRERPELFDAFEDPDFTFLLGDASRVTASSGQAYTEELLVDLLINRAEQKESLKVRLMTSKAIAAADKLSLDALNGLTANWALGRLYNDNVNFEVRYQGHISLWSTLVSSIALPTDNEWLEDLEVLGLSQFPDKNTLTRKSFDEFAIDRFSIFLVEGFTKADIEELITAVPADLNIWSYIAHHPFIENRFILSVENGDSLKDKIGRADLPAIDELIALNKFGILSQDAKDKYLAKLSEEAVYNSVKQWWDNLPVITTNLVGDVIAYVNIKRFIALPETKNIEELIKLTSTKRHK